ncbi:hypothetical protein GLUCOINTEAF2_0204180 [Komagataeibacter intermedius AF2]|uniref:Uncharacterized protein n=1 Tax=Komagataeibacter intermedius AF2 TaxID=1458464 RepID=A0A0N1FBZ1_9PROT|nr:hypothetical protein GLUCOINTEAF2_0204180 [Komagataeibacter intermedius AF2]
MFTFAVSGVAEPHGWGREAAKWGIVAHVIPQPSGHGAPPGQHGHCGIVRMQTPGCQHMCPDQRGKGRQRRRAGPHPVGQRRGIEIDPLTGKCGALPVQRQMLQELVAQDARKQLWPGPSARDRVERCRGLDDVLAVAAGEFLAYRLNHLELARDHLQRLGDALPQFAQALAATARAMCRHGDDDPFAREIGAQRLATVIAPGRCRPHGRIRSVFRRILGVRRLQIFQFEFELGQQTAPPLR